MSNIKMRGPQDCANTASFADQIYTADTLGIFTVPVEAYESFALNGFTAVGDLADTGAQS